MSIEAIKEALAAGPTSAYIKHFIHDEKWQENIEFAKACNPAAIRELIERLEAAEKDAAHIAAIAHEGGAAKLNEHGALVYIRRLSLPYWISNGGHAQQEKRVGAAIDSAMQSGGLAEGVSDGRSS
jgi:hypothetical protein